MFFKKQDRIEELELELSDAREKLKDALESRTGYEGQVIAFTGDLVREREINQALADENRDLVRQLQLLQSLFGQLQIAVKLPAKRG